MPCERIVALLKVQHQHETMQMRAASANQIARRRGQSRSALIGERGEEAVFAGGLRGDLRPFLKGAGKSREAHGGDRARLSEVAIKAFLALSKAWGLSNAEASDLIGVSASSFDRFKRGYRPSLSQDQLTRISALVGIYKGLHLLFADSTADEWIRRGTAALSSIAKPRLRR